MVNRDQTKRLSPELPVKNLRWIGALLLACVLIATMADAATLTAAL